MSITVVGSMNMDLVITTEKYPGKGETVIGKDFKKNPGGKGANQAVSIAKLGEIVNFIGACGDDEFGNELIHNLEETGVNTDYIFQIDGENTGTAFITVEASGENRIIAVQGANNCLEQKNLKKIQNKICESDILLLQLEIPVETVLYAIDIAYENNTKIILDPAPVKPLPKKIYKKIDYLLPNEGELKALHSNNNISEEECAQKLLNWGLKRLIITKGNKGLTLYSQNDIRNYQAIEVEARDTTAAGDSFAGTFAYGLAQNWSEDKAIRFANLAAAISVTNYGAQTSLPEMKELREKIELLQKYEYKI